MASKRGIRRRRCTGTKDVATVRQAARDVAALSRREMDVIEAYRCPNGGEIPVGNRPRWHAPVPEAGRTAS